MINMVFFPHLFLLNHKNNCIETHINKGTVPNETLWSCFGNIFSESDLGMRRIEVANDASNFDIRDQINRQ